MIIVEDKSRDTLENASYTADRKYLWYDFLPDIENLRDSYIALHEYIGLVF